MFQRSVFEPKHQNNYQPANHISAPARPYNEDVWGNNAINTNIYFKFVRPMIQRWTATLTPGSALLKHQQAATPTISAILNRNAGTYPGCPLMTTDSRWCRCHPPDDPYGYGASAQNGWSPSRTRTTFTDRRRSEAHVHHL